MTEQQLIQELKSGKIRRLYFLYGKETFLVQHYAARILSGCNADGMNLTRFSGNPDITALADSVETLPVFADRRVVMLNDLDPEKTEKDTLDELCAVLEKTPQEACVIIHITGFVPDIKKAKTKKLISVIEKHGAVVELEKISDINAAITKRANQFGCGISPGNASLLARLCLNNYTLIIRELEKLCAYADYKGEITQASIEQLTARCLDAGVFALAGEITSKRGTNAMKLLDELIESGNPSVVIMSSLSMTFIDLYRAKIGASSGKRAEQIVKDFAYPANRSWVVGKAISASSRMSVQQTRECVRVLCDADYRLKSSPVNDRIIMEHAIAELLTLC
jgi:DNA polymerase-3 subunit delta